MSLPRRKPKARNKKMETPRQNLPVVDAALEASAELPNIEKTIPAGDITRELSNVESNPVYEPDETATQDIPKTPLRPGNKYAGMSARERMLAKIRESRKPLHTRSKLKFPDRPGYVRRVFNDQDARIQEAKEAGWTEVVDDKIAGGDSSSTASKQVGTVVRRPVGGGIHGVLMEIPVEIYTEDDGEKQKRIMNVEKALSPKDGKLKTEDGNTTTGYYGSVNISNTQ